MVILLCEHNEDGSFGLILNNTLEIEINSVVTDFPEAKIPVGFGGPVERNQCSTCIKTKKSKDRLRLEKTFTWAEITQKSKSGFQATK